MDMTEGPEPGWVFHAAAMLLDLDGTLVDSSASIARSWGGWSHRVGVDAATVAAVSPGRTAADVVRIFLPGLSPEEVVREEDLLLWWQASDSDDVTATPGAWELMDALPPDRLAIVTACNRRLAVARLRAAGLPVPEVIVGCDSVHRGKPNPEGYLRAAELLRVDPRTCLVVEDAEPGVQAGHAAGARVIGVGEGARSADLPIGGLSELGVRVLARPPREGRRQPRDVIAAQRG
jgi:mannitol-1-/sugar-/sorbitol-6-phosphatase